MEKTLKKTHTHTQGIYAYGFSKPSAIQQRAILPIILGRDVIAQSQSGTGKTAVFTISALQVINERVKECQVLIVSPTRELAEQTCKVMMSIADFMSVNCRACIGGKSVGEDIRALDAGVQVGIIYLFILFILFIYLYIFSTIIVKK